MQLGDGDGILVVFSEEVDPASLVPQMLLVVSEAGRRSPPERALLSPASERDENRSVLLVGEFSEAEDAPGDVLVVGPLFTEGGVSLRGLSREIEPVDAPGRVVLAERIRTEDDTCAGARQVVRTYWTDVLRGVEAADLEGVRVSLGSGAEVKPMAFDDHAEGGDRGHDGEDNVLDLCLRDDDPARELRIEPGVFEDAAGHPSDAVEIAIVAPRLRRP